MEIILSLLTIVIIFGTALLSAVITYAKKEQKRLDNQAKLWYNTRTKSGNVFKTN